MSIVDANSIDLVGRVAVVDVVEGVNMMHIKTSCQSITISMQIG